MTKTKKLGDWHTHNSLCRHATGCIEDYIKRAIEENLNTIGLSDHLPNAYSKTHLDNFILMSLN